MNDDDKMSGVVTHPTTVVSLVCHAHVGMAIQCLGSLVQYSEDPLEVRIVGDGSLTQDDKARLEDVANIKVADYEETCARAVEALADFPNLAKLREQTVMLRKVIDCMIVQPGSEIYYCDSDVLFLRPFKGLFTGFDGCAMMWDNGQSYSINVRHAFEVGKRRLINAGNAGLVKFPKHLIPMPKLEELASSEFMLGWIPHWEQTMWSVIGSENGIKFYDPVQVGLVTPTSTPDSRLVAAHFYGPGRHRLNSFPRPETDSTDVVSIRLIEPKRFSALAYAGAKIRHRILRRNG